MRTAATGQARSPTEVALDSYHVITEHSGLYVTSLIVGLIHDNTKLLVYAYILDCEVPSLSVFLTFVLNVINSLLQISHTKRPYYMPDLTAKYIKFNSG